MPILPVLYRASLYLIHFIHSGWYLLIPCSYMTLPTSFSLLYICVSVLLYCIHLKIFLGSTYMSKHTEFVFVIFTEYNMLQVHLCCCKWQYVILSLSFFTAE